MRKSKVVQKNNMILLFPEEKASTKKEEKADNNHFQLGSNSDFVFSSEKSVNETLNFKFGSFKYHNPQCNDIILLEDIEIEASPRFFTRTSFEELWKLYIFLQDHPEIFIKINGYPSKTDKYKDEEAIKLTAHATENIQKFLIHQNIDIERIPYESANKIVEKRKLPFYMNQPFWIEIVIMKL